MIGEYYHYSISTGIITPLPYLLSPLSSLLSPLSSYHAVGCRMIKPYMSSHVMIGLSLSVVVLLITGGILLSLHSRRNGANSNDDSLANSKRDV